MDTETQSMHDYILVAVCYRGWRSTQIKSMVITHDNELLMISSETQTVHVFHIGDAVRAENNLEYVRKNQINSCLHFKTQVFLKEYCS